MEFESSKIRQRLIRDLRLSPEGAEIYDTVAKFAVKQLAPQRERTDLYPLVPFLREQAGVLASQGMFGLMVAENDGGTGLSLADLNCALIALAEHEASFATLLLVQNIAAQLIGRHATGIPRDRMLAAILGGSLAAYPLFHDPKDDMLSLTVEQGRLMGNIRNLTLAPVADMLLVPAWEKGALSLFWVNAKAKGVQIGEPVLMHGLRQCAHADVRFDIAQSDEFGRIGAAGEARQIMLAVRNRFAGSVLAVAGGIALAATTCTGKYMHERYQTGSQLIDKTALKTMLADLKIAAWETLHAAQRLSTAAEAGVVEDDVALPPLVHYRDRVADLMPDAIQLMGGYAYMRDFPQEQRYRDARQLQAVFGRSEFIKCDFIESAVAV